MYKVWVIILISFPLIVTSLSFNKTILGSCNAECSTSDGCTYIRGCNCYEVPDSKKDCTCSQSGCSYTCKWKAQVWWNGSQFWEWQQVNGGCNSSSNGKRPPIVEM